MYIFNHTTIVHITIIELKSKITLNLILENSEMSN